MTADNQHRNKAKDCPHCGKHCLRFWSKARLGPLATQACAACGRKVSVQWWPSIVFITLSCVLGPLGGVVLFYLAGPVTSLPSLLIVLCSGAAIFSAPLVWLYVLYVPLVPRER